MAQDQPLLSAAAALHFKDVIVKLTGNNNDIRREAEAYYNDLKTRSPEQLVLSLLHFVLSEDDVAVRVMCAVMLRQELGQPKRDNPWTWTFLSPQVFFLSHIFYLRNPLSYSLFETDATTNQAIVT
jgi:hypothetical protein